MDRVVGAWQYGVEWHRGKARIDSSHTGVAARFRRRGVAQALWMHGISRWKPARIEAQIGTNEGRDFLARMLAKLAYVAPETFLFVRTREEDHACWEDHCWHAAREFLRRPGRERIARDATKKPALAVVKAGP